MLSKSNKNLIEIARLGLIGERQELFDLLQKIAVSEINNNRHEVYNSLMKLLAEIEGSPIGTRHVQSASAMKQSYHVDVKKIWLPSSLKKRLDRILEYYRRIEKLQDDQKLNRILLYGPPGTGKTTLGFYIAEQLKLPTRYVKVTDVMSSRLGETMKNIADIFHTPGREVIFIDEFDAFAKTRADNNDVGELKRIVNSIIQTLDFSASNKIVIVATNLIDTIDSAILRRFPFKIEVGALSDSDKKDFLGYLIEHDKSIETKLSKKEWDFIFSVFNLLNLDTVDEIKGVIEKAKMEMILGDRKEITYKDFLEILLFDGYLSSLKNIKSKNEKLLTKLLKEVESMGYPKVVIASVLGIHRNTYPKYSPRKK
ncbi:MAG TPA: ATP-binding protein [Candidatus Paceibacterota bacterium]